MRGLGLLVAFLLVAACGSGGDGVAAEPAPSSPSAPDFAETEPCRVALEEVQPLRVALPGADTGRAMGLLDQLEAVVKIGQDECSEAVNGPLVEGYANLRAEVTAASLCAAEPCITGGDFGRGVRRLLAAETAAKATE